MALHRHWIALGAAAIAGIGAALAAQAWLADQAEKLERRHAPGEAIDLVVAKRDLPKGTRLVADVVAVRRVPREWAHGSALTPDEFGHLEGRALAHPALRGEPIVLAQLDTGPAGFSQRLPAGRRAVTVAVDEVNSISGLLAPGDRIDIVATIRHGRRSALMPLLQDAVVLATGAHASLQDDGSTRGRRGFTTITLEVTPEESQRLLAAREAGRIAAVLRAPGDREVGPTAIRDPLVLLGVAAPPGVDTQVPVIYGGQRLDAVPGWLAPLSMSSSSAEGEGR